MTTQQEIEQLRAATREAHEAIQEMRDVRRDLERFVAEYKAAMGREVKELLQAEARAITDGWAESLAKARDATLENFAGLVERAALGLVADQIADRNVKRIVRRGR